MKRSPRNRLIAALGGAVALALAIPAFSQSQDAPESLLPPGFGDPDAPLPPPVATPTPAPTATPAPVPLAPPPPGIGPAIEGALDELAEAELPPPPPELPDAARRSPLAVGPLGPSNWGLGADAWGRSDGRYLSTLMRRLDAPLPSRWQTILLRRALLSYVPAPAGVHPVDWVAERAWLLLRMGEADGARMLVQSVDVDQFTPKMFQIAVQAALATADPAGLCPLVAGGRAGSSEAVWPLADAMCAAMAGEAERASAAITQARRRGGLDTIDVSLAEKVVGAGANTRRAVTIEWDGVDRLTAWRFGLAGATGLALPQPLLAGAGRHVRAWHARAPMVPIADRADSAEIAAALGVFSNPALVEMYSLIADGTDPAEIEASIGGRLRVAYAGRGSAARLAAIRGLWDDAGGPNRRYGRQVLTGVAASRIAPDSAVGADAVGLVESMLAAGLDARAARWAAALQELDGEAATRGWALIATGTPRSADPSRFGGFVDADNSHGKRRSHMVLAALTGLGRIDADNASSLAQDLGVRLGAENDWTRALERAVQAREPATVALLAAVGMQTGGWAGVPAQHLYRIVRALRLVGLEYEARMIAAEAVTRA